MKPFLWENTIQLPLDEVYTRLEVKWRRTSNFQLTGEEKHMFEIFNLNKPKEKLPWHRKLLVKKSGKGQNGACRGKPWHRQDNFLLKNSK